MKEKNLKTKSGLVDNRINKLRSLCIIVFSLFSISVYSQDLIPDSLQNKPKSYGELSYEFVVAPGYAHIWNIKNKLRLGAAFHVGFAKSLFIDYSDFFMVRIFARDLFGTNKKNKPAKYDLGLFSSVSFQNEAIFYGLSFCYYFNISNRFRLGIDSHFGRVETDDSHAYGGYLIPAIYFKLKK